MHIHITTGLIKAVLRKKFNFIHFTFPKGNKINHMQVLKFGGTSVANSVNIHKVISIVEKSAQKEPVVLVVSALGGITDLLLQTGEFASHADEAYKELLKAMET